MTLTARRFDKKCGKSGIPDNAKCSKKTTAKSSSSTSKAKPKASLQEKYYSVAGGVQTALAARNFLKGNKGAALRNLRGAGVSASEVLEERAERTGNKRLLQFASGKNAVESALSTKNAISSIQKGNLKAGAFSLLNAANTGFETASFRAQSQGKSLSEFRERNRVVANTLQKAKIVGGLASVVEPSWKYGRKLGRQQKATEAARRRNWSRSFVPDDENGSLWAVGFKVDEGTCHR